MPWLIAILFGGAAALVLADKAHDRTLRDPKNYPGSDYAAWAKSNPGFGWLGPKAKDSRDVIHTGMFGVFPKDSVNDIYWFNIKDGSAAGHSLYTGTPTNP